MSEEIKTRVLRIALNLILIIGICDRARAMDPEDRKYWEAMHAPQFHEPVRHARGHVFIHNERLKGKRFPISIVFSGGNMIFDGPLAAHLATGKTEPVYLSQNSVFASDTLVMFQSSLFRGMARPPQIGDPDYPQNGDGGTGVHNWIYVRTKMVHSPSDVEKDGLVLDSKRIWFTLESFYFDRGFIGHGGRYHGFLAEALQYAGELLVEDGPFDYDKWLNERKMRPCTSRLQ